MTFKGRFRAAFFNLPVILDRTRHRRAEARKSGASLVEDAQYGLWLMSR